jgi:hypothetical protein
MATRQTTSRSLKSILGASIFALGFLLLLVNLDAVATQVSSTICTRAEAPGMLAAIGLASLHAVQHYTFNHDEFLSSLVQILVSFWPLILILVGAVLLRDVFRSPVAARRTDAGSSAAGER